jgi:RNA polymerase sigma factor (TIGR02999 family)
MSFILGPAVRLGNDMSSDDPQPGGNPASHWLSKVYPELRRKAQLYLKAERSGHTLNATALVHEAYIKLAAGSAPPDFERTGHFYAAAAEAMRRILVDHARARLAQKRGGHGRRLGNSALDNVAELSDAQSPEEILALDEALSRLGLKDAQAAEVVRLRFFAGLDVEQTAKVLRVSPRTVKRQWQFARAWLYRELEA